MLFDLLLFSFRINSFEIVSRKKKTFSSDGSTNEFVSIFDEQRAPTKTAAPLVFIVARTTREKSRFRRQLQRRSESDRRTNKKTTSLGFEQIENSSLPTMFVRFRKQRRFLDASTTSHSTRKTPRMPRLSVRHRIQTSSRISSEKSRRIKTVQMFKMRLCLC